MTEPLTGRLTEHEIEQINSALGGGAIFSEHDAKYMTALILREIVSLRETANNLEYMISQIPANE